MIVLPFTILCIYSRSFQIQNPQAHNTRHWEDFNNLSKYEVFHLGGGFPSSLQNCDIKSIVGL